MPLKSNELLQTEGNDQFELEFGNLCDTCIELQNSLHQPWLIDIQIHIYGQWMEKKDRFVFVCMQFFGETGTTVTVGAVTN